MTSALERLGAALRESGRAGVVLRAAAAELIVERSGLRVVVLDATAGAGEVDRALGAVAEGDALLVVGGAVPPRAFGRTAPIALLPGASPSDELTQAALLAIDGLFDRLSLRRAAGEDLRELSRERYERGELVEIARAITQERDIDSLLHLILEKSRYITGADAGSIYVLEGDAGAPGGQRLRFKLSQNDSISFESSEFVMPVSKTSIAGTVVLERRPINIEDVYVADADASLLYGFDESFDERVGYRSISMLTMPMISAEDVVIGVIQLINKKRNPRAKLETEADRAREVVPFDARSEELLHALAAQAGIALENALLYEEIRNIFEGFVRASVQAIEQRDPTTSGHSLRVSVLSCALAEAVDKLDCGPFGGASFSRRDLQELKYAALLHDFGKIGVREQVLVKAKKLYPHEREAIRSRIEYAIAASQIELLREQLRVKTEGGAQRDLDRIAERIAEREAALREAWSLIERANEPTVLGEGDFSRIAELGALTYRDHEGRPRPLLSEREVGALQVSRGSLSGDEIDEIRWHVRHTYDFLARIPWGRSMQRIPEIAGAHHEKLDGSGYPRGLVGDAIPLPSKIMTVADIYDALTAHDRPYKKALPRDRALQILGFEVRDGHLDPELVRIFREAEIFRAAEGELAY